MSTIDYPASANPAVALLVVVATALIGAFALSRPRLSRFRRSRSIEFVWLTVATIGLVSACASIRKMIADRSGDALHARIQGAYGGVRMSIRGFTAGIVCRNFTRTDYSPSNLDEIQAEYNVACEWAREVSDALPRDAPSVVGQPALRAHPRFTDSFLNGVLGEFDGALSQLREAQEAYAAGVRESKPSTWEIALGVFAPYVIALALGMKFAKLCADSSATADACRASRAGDHAQA